MWELETVFLGKSSDSFPHWSWGSWEWCCSEDEVIECCQGNSCDVRVLQMLENEESSSLGKMPAFPGSIDRRCQPLQGASMWSPPSPAWGRCQPLQGASTWSPPSLCPPQPRPLQGEGDQNLTQTSPGSGVYWRILLRSPRYVQHPSFPAISGLWELKGTGVYTWAVWRIKEGSNHKQAKTWIFWSIIS